MQAEEGADIIINRWMRTRKTERLLIVTSEEHRAEAELLKKQALRQTKNAEILLTKQSGKHVGVWFDEHPDVFSGYTAVIAATDYSLVTTKAAKKAIEHGVRFLSLPLSTNSGRSMLCFDFLKMDVKKSKLMAQVIMKYLREASFVRITTALGTDLKVFKRGRAPGFFNGVVRDGKGFSSASIEVYVPIEEDATEGIMMLDGSLGYIGAVTEPTRIRFQNGRITEIADTKTGERLRKYMASYNDAGIYVAGELGIGLNSYSRCIGECYIEDESAYGTFHIGVGRNIALGGVHEANGHFDLVVKEPDLYADNRQLIQAGKIIIPEPVFY